jgi:hypothetical protein
LLSLEASPLLETALGALARIDTSSVGHLCVKRDLISVKRDLLWGHWHA